jgi:hypothetical protein
MDHTHIKQFEVERERVMSDGRRVEAKRKLWVRSNRHFIWGRGRKNVFLFNGSQAMHARHSDKDKTKI